MKNTAKVVNKDTIDSIHALYNKAILSKENSADIDNIHAVCKKHAIALRDYVKNINKAVYNIDYSTTAQKEEKTAISTLRANMSRRSVVIACLETNNCTQQDILDAIDTYADTKYFQLTSANKKCILGTCNDLRVNKKQLYLTDTNNVYKLKK
jgi:hypothetical protein